MRVRSRAGVPLLMFCPAGVFEVGPGEEFDVPADTPLPPSIQRVADAPEPKASPPQKKDGDV